MLKIRVMPTLLYKDLGLVKGVAFDSCRRVGGAMQAVKVYNMREVDELVFLDISATTAARGPDLATVDEIADECFMPLTVGGGVRSEEDADALLRAGADKVAVNTAAIKDLGLVTRLANRFGAQCVVVSIDARRNSAGKYEVYTTSGAEATGRDPATLATEAERHGAGELLITSIDTDGTMSGYDIPLMKSVTTAVSIPVIASGGAGTYSHMAEVLDRTEASAVAAASMYHFTEQTPKEAKRYLHSQGFPVRL